MAWQKLDWSVLIGTSCTTQTTLVTNSVVCGDYDCDTTTEIIVANVRVSLVYPAAPNADCQVDIYSRDTDKCNVADTLSTFSATIPPLTTSGIGINTYAVNVAAMDHIRVCITNPDLTNSVEVLVTVKGAWG